MVNQKFDESKYPGNKDILQIRYTPQSEIAGELRKKFISTHSYLMEKRHTLPGNQRKFIKMPDERKEYLALYTILYEDTYLPECITKEDI